MSGQCLLVQDSGRKGGQVTVDHSRLPAALVILLFLGGAPVEQAREHYPWLKAEDAAVLHRLAADLRDRAVTSGVTTPHRPP